MTERLIPFDLEEWRKRPLDLRHAHGDRAVEIAEVFGCVAVKWETGEYYLYDKSMFHVLCLTAPAPKRVEVRAALWTSGRFTLWFKDFNIAETDDQFVRWLTNWHIEDSRVFVEVE